MRPAAYVALCLVSLGACEPDSQISPVTVEWMDWPADVAAGTPFVVRLVVFQPCAATGFNPGPTADQSAVTFAPYFLELNPNVLCYRIMETALSIAPGALDTVGTAPGLPATYSRTYEMRAAASVYAPGAAALASLPVRTFGQVTVRPSAPDLSRRNAAGMVFMEADTLGCVRIRPFGVYRPDAALVLENQTDTAGLSGAFVRGYIYAPAAPVCGETKVFHLMTQN